MPLIINPFESPPRFFQLASFALLTMAVCFAPSVATAQVLPSEPSPTPDPDIPIVVSRDDDIERLIRGRTDPVTQEAGNVSNRGTRESDVRTGLDSLSEKEQKRLVLYLDILTKLEDRAETLRSQLINMIEKQNNVSTKIQQVEYNLRPEVISGVTSLSGSFRPEDLREQRKSELEIEKRNLETLLSQIETAISSLENNLSRADQMAEQVRIAFERLLEDALYNEVNP